MQRRPMARLMSLRKEAVVAPTVWRISWTRDPPLRPRHPPAVRTPADPGLLLLLLLLLLLQLLLPSPLMPRLLLTKHRSSLLPCLPPRPHYCCPRDHGRDPRTRRARRRGPSTLRVQSTRRPGRSNRHRGRGPTTARHGQRPAPYYLAAAAVPRRRRRRRPGWGCRAQSQQRQVDPLAAAAAVAGAAPAAVHAAAAGGPGMRSGPACTQCARGRGPQQRKAGRSRQISAVRARRARARARARGPTRDRIEWGPGAGRYLIPAAVVRAMRTTPAPTPVTTPVTTAAAGCHTRASRRSA
jgi:hypothetical protein